MTVTHNVNSTEFIEQMFPKVVLSQEDRTLLDDLMGHNTTVTAPAAQMRIVEQHILWRILTHCNKDVVIVAGDRHIRKTITDQLNNMLMDLDCRGIKTNCLLRVLGLSCIATDSSIKIMPPSTYMLRGTTIDTLVFYINHNMLSTTIDEVIEYAYEVGRKNGTNVIILREFI